MELLLNLVWLLASAVLAGAAFVHAKNESSWDKRWIIVVAALCLLVTLFPVISMSDDLQQVSFMAEEKVQGTLVHDVHAESTPHLDFVHILTIFLLFQAVLIMWEASLESSGGFSLLSGFRTLVSSRPPPFLSFQ
jgi:hypothetical protein